MKTNREVLDSEEYLEPATVRDLLDTDDSLTVQKELVKKLIKHTEAPFVDFYVFENVVHVLNDMEPAVGHVEGSTPEMIWKALLKIKDMREDFTLSHEVKMYTRFIYKNHGLTFLPEGFGFPNPNIEEVKQRAQKADEETLTDDSPLDIQAIKYLRIQEYINR